jgi:hypothetical protein
MIDETLFANEWLSLKRIVAPEKGINGYIYSHETRCNGKIISILPYRLLNHNREIQFLLRSEVTPCWDVNNPTFSTITGGTEEPTPQLDAIRELREEAGYQIELKELIDLGTSYGSKSSDTRYHVYSVDLGGKERGAAAGDGSHLEEAGEAIWVDGKTVLACQDPIASVALIRLLILLNIQP